MKDSNDEGGFENPYDYPRPAAGNVKSQGVSWMTAFSSMATGLIVLVASRGCDDYTGKGSSLSQTQTKLTEVSVQLTDLKAQIDRLLNQPYETRDEHARDITRIEGRLDSLEARQHAAK